MNTSHRWPASCPMRLSAVELLGRVVGVLVDIVHHHDTAQAAGAAVGVRLIVDVNANAANLVRDGHLVRERVVHQVAVGPHQDLVVSVRMRDVEFLAERNQVDLVLRDVAFAERARASADRRRRGRREIDRVERGRVAW
jgi:hypothetical protein